MKTIEMKGYETPKMTLCEVVVERGFSNSPGGDGGLTPPDMPGIEDSLE